MDNWRIYFVFFVIFSMGFGISARLFYLQIIKGGYYMALAKGQHTSFVESVSFRGDIFFQDKFNTDAANPGLSLAATNKDIFLLYADTEKIEDAGDVSQKIAPVLYEYYSYRDPKMINFENSKVKINEDDDHSELDTDNINNDGFLDATRFENTGLKNIEEELEKTLKSESKGYKKLSERIDEAAINEIKSLNIEGLSIRKEKARYYPSGFLAAHTLGFVGFDGYLRIGQYGVEGFYDDLLRGNIKTETFSLLPGVSASGSSRFGKNIILTIDYNIQLMLESKLKEYKERLNAESASAVIMDPKTGSVLALLTLDSFDPNYYSSVSSIDIFLNDIAQKMFEPGSVFKPITMAAAIDAGVVSPVTKYTDTGEVVIGKYTIKNSDNKAHGEKTMTNVLELSLNTGAVFAEQNLGHDKFREYIKKFGFGEKTGVDVQGEVRGDIKNILETNRDVNFATATFGQGIAVTPIQLITAFSAIANGGNMVKPHLLKAIVHEDGTYEEISPEIVANPISAKTAGQITSMLVSAVENGYGKKAMVLGYKVAGKTGTAQIAEIDGKGYLEEETIHSFIGFTPAYDPKFLALIKMDKPKTTQFSSESIAPLFSEISEFALNYYEIPPDS